MAAGHVAMVKDGARLPSPSPSGAGGAYPGVLKVGRRGGFAGALPNAFTNEGAIVIRGRFVRRGTAKGTVRYTDRGCVGTNPLTWTARVLPARR